MKKFYYVFNYTYNFEGKNYRISIEQECYCNCNFYYFIEQNNKYSFFDRDKKIHYATLDIIHQCKTKKESIEIRNDWNKSYIIDDTDISLLENYSILELN